MRQPSYWFLILSVFCLTKVNIFAAHPDAYNTHFKDSTLRIDYIISGVRGNAHVSVKNKYESSGWYGRNHNLDQLFYSGNGDVTVATLSGDTIYRNSFSTLFNEWYDLADPCSTAFELSVLMPYPKDSICVTVSLRDKRHDTVASLSHTVDPQDILIRHYHEKPNAYHYIHQGTYPGHRISVAILPEGYTAAEMPDFFKAAKQTVDAILAVSPFAEYRDRFDFLAIEIPSEESGVSIPKVNIWRSTPFHSHFSTFYSDRYITTSDIFAIHQALTGVPYEHIIILANTDEYGGGGIFNNYTLTSARNRYFEQVIVHEFGHSFGGLTDEYFYQNDVMSDTYPLDIEPWEPNITTLVDFDSKWRHLIPAGTPVPTDPADGEKYPVGLYEGGGYSSVGIYRPADNCRMRSNSAKGFCPACQDAISRLILYYTQ